jgi:hypothetical protein
MRCVKREPADGAYPDPRGPDRFEGWRSGARTAIPGSASTCRCLVTSNKPFGAWGEIFGDDMAATAMIDRLIHHSEILSLKGAATACAARTSTPGSAPKAPKSADRSPSGTSLRTARSRYDVRGEDDPYSSDDPACTAGR